jgi:hypothetical protein
MRKRIADVVDSIANEAYETYKALKVSCEEDFIWTGVERVVAIAYNTIEINSKHIITIPKNCDLVVGIVSNECDVITFCIQIGGYECLQGPHTLSCDGFLPLKVPMLCWYNSVMQVVCDRPCLLTVVYGMMLDDSERRAIVRLGAFQRMGKQQQTRNTVAKSEAKSEAGTKGGRIMWYNGSVAEVETDADYYNESITSTMVDLGLNVNC